MPLSHLRVVEIGSSSPTAYAARLFADFGATVEKVESIAGDPMRRAAPITRGGNSAWFAFLNTNKSSVVMDASDPRSIERLTALIGRCDILLDGRPIAAADCPAIDLDAIKVSRPGLIHVSASWFGDKGPYAHFHATDSTIRALTGLVKLAGPVEGPPVLTPDFQAGLLSGLWIFIAAVSSAFARMSDSRGRSTSLSVFESTIALTEYIMFEAFARGDIMRRMGINRFWPTFPVGIYETKDGWLGVTTVTPAQWRSFCEMLGLVALRDDASLYLGVDRLAHIAMIEEQFIPRLKEQTTQHWFAEGMVRKIPVVPVPSIADLLRDTEKRSRGAIVPIEIGGEHGFTVGAAQRLISTPPKAGGKAPDVGERQTAQRSSARHAPDRAHADLPRRLPLHGVRVIDFSMGWAGPLCTRTLADLGADVIKIEAIQYPDWWRGVDRRAAYLREQAYEKVSRFCIMNRNKRGITLDLTKPRGVALAKRLVADADVVVDNYSVDVLPKLGLGYDVLSKLNSRLVVMSMSAFGSQSAYRACRAYGSTLEQGSGLPSVSGASGDPPTMTHTAFGDAVGGLNGSAALLVALTHARKTGRGQFIDLSQIECMMPFLGPWLISHSIDGEEPVRYGGRHPEFVPHGCFACSGNDGWIVVAASDDAMWQRLCDVLQRPDWAADPDLATAPNRRRIEAEIEKAIEAWTRVRDPDQAMAELQRAGIAAGVARLPIEMLTDPHLLATGFIQNIDRAFIGPHPQPSMPLREGSLPYAVRSPAPTLGQHNREVLGGILGLSDNELGELSRDGIIGTRMTTVE